MEENKRKQYAHLYEHHEVEDPQPREEKEKPIGPSGRNRHRPMVEKEPKNGLFKSEMMM